MPTVIKNLADNTGYLTEKVSLAEVEKIGKNLKVNHTVLIDPNTGKVLGASDFFPAFKSLSFTQAGAVQNTWYTAFSGANVSFNALGIGITVANETVEARITVDGVVIPFTAGIALLFATNKFTNVLATGLVLTTGVPTITSGAAAATLVAAQVPDTWLKGRIVLIEVRKTTAGGASAIQVFGVYHQ